MTITVKWDNALNDNVTAFQLFRSETEATVYDPANKIAEVANNVFEFVDTNVVEDRPYFYGIRSVTSLGNMDGKIRVGVWLVYKNGPWNGTIPAGDGTLGLMDFKSAVSDSRVLWGLAEQLMYSVLASVPTISVRAGYASVVPGYEYSDMTKAIRNGSVVFFPGDYGTHVRPTSATERNAFYGALRAFIAGPGLTFDYNGYQLKLDLMTKNEYNVFATQLYAGPVSDAGFVPRVCEKPIPAHTGHYICTRDGNKVINTRTAEDRPFATTIQAEALDSDPFSANQLWYAAWVIRVVG